MCTTYGPFISKWKAKELGLDQKINSLCEKKFLFKREKFIHEIFNEKIKLKK